MLIISFSQSCLKVEQIFFCGCCKGIIPVFPLDPLDLIRRLSRAGEINTCLRVIGLIVYNTVNQNEVAYETSPINLDWYSDRHFECIIPILNIGVI